MAILNFGGAEEGNSSYAAFLYASGQSITSSVARTGTYSYNHSTQTTAEYMLFGALSGLLPVSLNTTSERFFTCYFLISGVSIGGSGPFIVATGSTPASQVICSLNIDVNLDVTLVGTSSVAVASAVTTNTWHRCDMRVTSNNTCYVKIDGGTEYSVTGNNFTLAAMGFGSPAATTDMLVRFDDWVIDDAAFPTYDPEVKIAVANAAGTYTDWTDGTGSTYAEVDEVTSDTTTTYIQNTSGTNVASTFRMQSKSTVGISGAIKGVIPTIVGHEPSSASTQVGIRVRSGATDYDTSTPDLGGTAWITRRVLHLTDPSTSVAWTEAGFDAVEIGPLKGADSSSVRVSSVWALVLSDGNTSQTVTLTGIASLESFGTPMIRSTVAPSAIASLEAFGTPTVAPQPVNVSPTGIASAESFGTLAAINISVIAPSSIASQEAFGTPVITPGSVNVTFDGIASEESFGSARLAAIVALTSIDSLETFGTPTVQPGSATITLSGIATAEQFGTPVITATIAFSGIATAEAFGTLSITKGSVTIALTGIPSEEEFGTLVILRALSGFLAPPPGGSQFAGLPPAGGSFRVSFLPPGGSSRANLPPPGGSR